MERKISINSEIGKLVLEPNESISRIDSPLKPFYYLANKAIKDQNKGLEIQIESEIPPGAGLGSSSACCVAGAAAIFKLFGEISKEENIRTMRLKLKKQFMKIHQEQIVQFPHMED